MSKLLEIHNRTVGLTDNEGCFADIVQMSIDDYIYLYEQAEKVEQLEKLQEKTASNLTKCRMKLSDIKIILNI